MKGCGLQTIDATAIVSESAHLGRGVAVGAHVVIYDNVTVGGDTLIGPGSILGEPMASYGADPAYRNPDLLIGGGSVIRSGAVIYCGSTLGDGPQTGHHVTIREYTRLGEHVSIGTDSDVQGYCTIGDFSRLHSSVFVCQKSEIGSFVWIFAGTILTNDPNPPSEQIPGPFIEDFAVVGAGTVILPGVRIGKSSLVGARSLVRRDVEPGTLVAGSPAQMIGELRDFVSRVTRERAYPWPEHFDRGMPWEGIGFKSWDEKRRSGSV